MNSWSTWTHCDPLCSYSGVYYGETHRNRTVRTTVSGAGLTCPISGMQRVCNVPDCDELLANTPTFQLSVSPVNVPPPVGTPILSPQLFLSLVVSTDCVRRRPGLPNSLAHLYRCRHAIRSFTTSYHLPLCEVLLSFSHWPLVHSRHTSLHSALRLLRCPFDFGPRSSSLRGGLCLRRCRAGSLRHEYSYASLCELDILWSE